MRQAMKRHGLALDPLIFDGGFSRQGGERPPPSSSPPGCRPPLVAANDQAAIGFVAGSARSGSTSPGDVSVVGYDDIAPCGFVEPPLTTVHVPLYDLGVRGMRRALQLLDGGPPATRSSAARAPRCGRARNHRKRRHAWPRSPSFTPGDDELTRRMR